MTLIPFVIAKFIYFWMDINKLFLILGFNFDLSLGFDVLNNIFILFYPK